MRFSLFASTSTVLAALALTSSIAAAQPAEEQPRELDPRLALGLSLGITAAGYGAVAIGSDQRAELTVPGFVALSLGPTAGHWYQGRIVTRGLVTRAVSAAALVYGLSQFELDCERNCRSSDFGDYMMLAGLVGFAVGTADDIITAPIEAQRTNRKNRARFVKSVSLAPQLSGNQTGLVLAGTF